MKAIREESVETNTMFLYWQTLNCKDVSSPHIAYKFNAIPIKIPVFFMELDKLILI